MSRKHLTRSVLALVALLGFVNYMPEALAFPYAREVHGVTIRSERPIADAIEAELARADALAAASPLAPIPSRRIFLTEGGWRWQLLTLQAHGAFGLTRPLSNAIVVNRSDVGRDAVWNGAPVAGRRSLSGVIAHETTHIMLVRRYGLRAATFPAWKIEGYADHVARESSLSNADAATLKAAGRSAPALRYYEGRKRVEQALAAGTSVDALFRGS